ncbi:MAG: FAD-dependent oxidoreductase [Clostridia bacterium]|nr:FAD-dependent oxidoreductase [Clostridia bacterium]
MTDICIIGAGIAGLTAAIYAQRAGLSCVVLEKNIYGGQMSESAEIDNYPCFPHTDGATLSNAVYEQATSQGADVRFEEVISVSDEGDIKKVTTSGGEYECRAVIFAGGAKRRLLGCEGEDKYTARGVSYCATCDGAFYRGKQVAVVGGGNTALEDALFLANMCEKVYLIHRRDSFRGDKVLSDAVRRNEKIELVLSAQVSAIRGEAKVSGVDVTYTSGEQTHLEVSGVFVAVGLIPDTSLLEGIVAPGEGGYIEADETGVTEARGFFVAGDCRKKQLRQIVTAASDGANAAFSAANYINSLKG